LAGEVFLGVVKRRNSMITDAISPVTIASTKALHASNSQLSALLSDYAIALGEGQPQSGMPNLQISGISAQEGVHGPWPCPARTGRLHPRTSSIPA